MESSLLIKFLGENPLFKIIDYLIENKGTDVTKKQIIEEAGISRAVLFKYWPQIEQQEMVRVTRQFGTGDLEVGLYPTTGNAESVWIGPRLKKAVRKDILGGFSRFSGAYISELYQGPSSDPRVKTHLILF